MLIPVDGRLLTRCCDRAEEKQTFVKFAERPNRTRVALESFSTALDRAQQTGVTAHAGAPSSVS